MIETEQTAVINAAIDDVWTYVRDIARWAAIMPGYRDCEIIDENDSRWTLKVGVGGLIRTVKVAVHIDEWSGPETVRFSYRLAGDPVQGGGAYAARALSDNRTEIALRVRVEGSGPMAPMWEAMGKPLLPQFAMAFANQLKDEIEKAIGSGDSGSSDQRGAGLWVWFARLWRRLFGQKSE